MFIIIADMHDGVYVYLKINFLISPDHMLLLAREIFRGTRMSDFMFRTLRCAC